MSQFNDDAGQQNERKVPAESFVATLAVNVDNPHLDDRAFREFVRNTLQIVQGTSYRQEQRQTGYSQFDGNSWQR